VPQDKTPAIDPIQLAADLIRCPSVTPVDAGALDILEAALAGLGFGCTRLPFSSEKGGSVDNLYARLGTAAPNFCFAGHSDVVPSGHVEDWSFTPFSGEVKRGFLQGRGASDMKGALAAFVSGTDRFLKKQGQKFTGSISFLITGDEEGPAKNGTIRVLQWLEEKGERLDMCLVGEPTNPMKLGEMIKNGRRGSLNITITVQGRQAHVAYPDRGDNPVPGLTKILDVLENYIWDQGTEHFSPTNLEVTNLEAGTGAFNVIPAKASAKFNIRFNDLHTSQGLIEKVEELCNGAGVPHILDFQIIGEAFLTEAPHLVAAVSGAVEKVLGVKPALSTTGGSSDARYIKDVCPVIEFGLTGETMHAVDERARTSDIKNLARIYEQVLVNVFSGAK